MSSYRTYSNKIINGANIYYVALIYRLFLSFIMMTEFTTVISYPLMNRLSYLAIILLLIKIYYFDKPSRSDLIKETLIIAVAIISWRTSRAIDILFFILFIIGAKNIDFRILIRLFVGSLTIMLVYTILISQMGVIQDALYRRQQFIRHSLGIVYPTDLAAYFFYLFLGYSYLFFEKLNWKVYTFIIIFSLIMYSLTQARMSTISMLLMVPVLCIAKRAYDGKKGSRLIASFYWMVPAVLSYLMLFISYFYVDSSKLLVKANHLLSDRLVLSHRAIHEYGFSLFGQHVVEHAFGGPKGYKLFYQGGMKYFYIDSSYVRLAVIYGLLIGALIIVIMTYLGYKSIKLKQYSIAAIMLLVGVHCFVEQHLLDISFDPFLCALLADNVFPSNKINSVEENNE